MVKRPVKKKKKSVVVNHTNKVASRTPRTRNTRSPKQTFSEPMDHYRLNLAEIPFVAGKVRYKIKVMILVHCAVQGYQELEKCLAQLGQVPAKYFVVFALTIHRLVS